MSKLRLLICKKCGYKWITDEVYPRSCPECNSIYWNRGAQAKNPEARMIKRSISLENQAQSELLTKLGGSQWIRDRILEASRPVDKEDILLKLEKFIKAERNRC